MRAPAMFAVCLALAGCDAGLIVDDGGGGVDGERGDEPDPIPLPEGQVEVSYREIDEPLLNPERGLFNIGSLTNGYDFEAVREAGATMSYVLVRLDDFRAIPLTDEFLATLDDGFALARAAGVKLVVRFAYNFDAGGADAPRDLVLQHLDQLTPVLNDNADVIATVQAGLIGAWGEWHSSASGLDNPDDRKAILEGLLAAVPASRAVMIRSPMYKAENWTGPLEARADDSPDGRISHHNDCFLASDTDKGTYAAPVDDWKDYVAQDGLFLPIGGETCGYDEARSSCDATLDELSRLRWSLLAMAGSEEVWDRWRSEGCDDEIADRLGYRFRLIRTRHSDAVAPGGALTVNVRLVNEGFASPYNPRPLYVVLEGQGRRMSAPLDVDPRSWRAGEEAIVAVDLRVPADLPAGDYRLSLWLPDAEESLRDRRDFAIRFANDEVWDDDRGTNTLATVPVDPAADGEVDPTATELAVIP